MNPLTNKEIVQGFFEIYNSKDYQAIHKYFAPNYYDHGLPQVRSAKDAIEILKITHQAFPDIQVVVDELIEESDQVAFRGHFRATHLGEFVGIAPSGAKIEFEALEIFKLQDGKVTESWGYWPMALIISQIESWTKKQFPHQ